MIQICGDIHGPLEIRKLEIIDDILTYEDDILIQLGDFGLLFDPVLSKEEKYWLKWLEEKPYKTLFIDGNHDNHILLKELPVVEMFGAKMGKVNEKVYHIKRGEIMSLDNKTIFCCGGASSIDKSRRTEGINWWKEEVISNSDINNALDNLEKVNNKVDVILTHTLPKSIVPEYDKFIGFTLNNREKDPTEEFLDHIYNNISFDRWFCGHFHIDKTLRKVRVVYDEFHNL